MIVLGVAVELGHMEQLGPGPFMERLAGLGVGAIEAQLPADMNSNEIARWSATLEAAARHELAVSLHVPLALEHPAWPDVLALAGASTAAAVLVGAAAAARPDPSLAEHTVGQLRRLADAAPSVTFALRNVANRDAGPLARARDWIARQRRQARLRSRPSGVGSAMGGQQARALPRAANEPFDPPLPRRRGASWNAAGTRDAALAICAAVARANCVFGWDLAHDWLAGRALAVAQPAVPPPEQLRRVGYVRVHDVDDSGNDRCLLVVGNVPYTTQLRALRAAGYAGTVCLAARYTAAMRPYGGRWQAFERSLRVLQQTLKLS